MKWLFLLLVAVNIVIFLWGVQRESESVNEPDSHHQNVGEIKLLTEADITALVAAQEQEKPVTLDADSTNEQEPGREQSAQVKAQQGALEEHVVEGDTWITAEPDIATSIQEEAQVDPKQTVQSINGESAGTLSNDRLVSKDEIEEPLRTQNETPQSVEADHLNVESEGYCWTLGPIEDKPAALALLDTVAARFEAAELREEQVRSISGFWVVLPPYEDARSAIAVVNQLKDRGVSDVQRFFTGELENGVSLGIYNRRFNAEKRREQIETKGFSPEVMPRYREELRFWIDFNSGSEVAPQVEMPAEYRDLTASQRECPAREATQYRQENSL